MVPVLPGERYHETGPAVRGENRVRRGWRGAPGSRAQVASWPFVVLGALPRSASHGNFFLSNRSPSLCPGHKEDEQLVKTEPFQSTTASCSAHLSLSLSLWRPVHLPFYIKYLSILLISEAWCAISFVNKRNSGTNQRLKGLF